MAIDPIGLGAVSDLAKLAINKIWPDKSEEERQQLANAFAIVQGQLEINKVEAANPSLFVSGWRPFVGWVCGCGLVYSFVGQPLLSWYSSLHSMGIPPSLDMGTLLTTLGGLLGLGGLRTVEKINGVASK